MILRFHHTPIRKARIKNSGESTCWGGGGERGTLLYCWKDWKMAQPLWKSIWSFLKKLEIDLKGDSAVPLLGIYPKDAPPCYRGTCSTIFIEVVISPDVPYWKNEYRKCDSFPQWNTILLLRMRTLWIFRQRYGIRKYCPEVGNSDPKGHAW